MKVKTLHELYIESLRDLFSAETQLLEALPKVAGAVTNRQLATALNDHLDQTKNQVARLEQIFVDLEEKAGGHTCAAMKGLIKEADELIEDVADKSVLDAALIGASQKVEHYEISGYGTARTFARLMGHTNHAALLQKTLDEEGAADSLLTEIAESIVNERANKTNPSSMQSSSNAEQLAPAGSSRRS